MLHDDILKFIDSTKVFRRFTLMVTLWMTWEAFRWGAEFASVWPALPAGKTGLELAAIIASVLAPISALQAAAFATYSKGVT
jgi:hypothetical protein